MATKTFVLENNEVEAVKELIMLAQLGALSATIEAIARVKDEESAQKIFATAQEMRKLYDGLAKKFNE